MRRGIICSTRSYETITITIHAANADRAAVHEARVAALTAPGRLGIHLSLCQKRGFAEDVYQPLKASTFVETDGVVP
jgi:hypothetical protein